MANEEHLAILKQGVEAWNRWREENPTIRPDLSGANLSEANLIKADLRRADLRGADLRLAHLRKALLGKADLRGADLGKADLRGADLRGADLGEANLRGADLRGADLRGADLRDADLTGADLSEAYLTGVDLSEATLRMATLSGAHLSKANLSGPALTGVNLSGTDLSGANIIKADLHGANLQGADLQGADLHGADLHGADLHGADLRGTNVEDVVAGYTRLSDVDLSVVKGLETVKHDGPSTIGIDTIYKSKGKIPEIFLRGCGVPDNFIAYVGSLVGKPIEYYSCFISYSSKDQECVERLHNDLQAKGVRCWFAPEDLKIGDKFRTRIDEAIRIHDKLLLVLSEHSVNSKWVEKEVETAFDKETPDHTVLFPIRLDEAVMKTDRAWAADIRRTRHIGDFCHWKDHDAYQKAFDRLLQDLKAESEVTR